MSAEIWTPEEHRSVYNKLATLATAHAGALPGLTVAEYDPANPYHQIDTTFVPATTTVPGTEQSITPASAVGLFEVFDPTYRERHVVPFEERPDVLDEVAERFEAGDDTAVMTGHTSLIEVLEGVNGLNVALAEQRGLDFVKLVESTYIPISKSVFCYEILGAHMIKLVSQLANIVAVYPVSDRMQGVGIPQEVINFGNRAFMRRLVEAKATPPETERDGIRLGVAAPGTSNVVDEHGVTHIQPVAPQTANLLARQGALMRVIGVPDQPSVVGELVATERGDGKIVEGVMAQSAHILTYLTGKLTVYDWPRTD